MISEGTRVDESTVSEKVNFRDRSSNEIEKLTNIGLVSSSVKVDTCKADARGIAKIALLLISWIAS